MHYIDTQESSNDWQNVHLVLLKQADVNCSVLMLHFADTKVAVAAS